MKKLLLGLALVSGLARAEDLSVTVKNFNFNYQGTHGTGTASYVQISPANPETNASVTVDRLGDDFKFVFTGAGDLDYELRDVPSFLVDAERIAVKNFNLALTDKLSASMDRGQFNSRKSDLDLKRLNLNCSRDARQTELADQLVSGCIQKMAFKTASFSSSSVDENVISIIAQSLVLAASDGKAMDGVGVESLDLRMTNGKYDLAAEVSNKISGKVKSHGNMSYDAQSGKLTIKISQVKLSIFDITSQVFDELKKQENDKLKVDEPYVYYSLR